jgi:DNA invertase Pin-like site-specific DNA recombinase
MSFDSPVRHSSIPPAIQVKRAAVYLRRSTTSLEQKNSLPDQFKAIRKGAADMRAEIDEELVYVDDGVTGTSLEHRTGIKKMLEAARSGKFRERGVEYLLYWATDRLARRTMDALALEAELLELGIIPYSVSENYDLRSPGGHLEFVLRSAFAELQNKLRNYDIQRGKRRAVRAGLRMSPPPYGYQRMRDEAGKSKLVIDAAEAEIVRRIFRQLLDGCSPVKISKQLHEEQLPTKSGGLWNITTVRQILFNEAYIGVCVFGLPRKARKKAPVDSLIVEADSHPPIIELDTFIRAQKILKDRSKLRRFTSSIKNFYLLSGMRILECGICGRPVIGFPQKRVSAPHLPPYTYYICSSRRQSRNCGLRGISTERLDNAVISAIGAYARNPDIVRAAWRQYKDAVLPRTAPLTDALAEVGRQLASTDRAIDRISKAYERRKMGLDTLGRRLKALEQEKKALADRRLALSQELANESIDIDEDAIVRQLVDFEKNFRKASPEQKKMLVHTLVQRVTIKSPCEIEITARFLPRPVTTATPGVQ